MPTEIKQRKKTQSRKQNDEMPQNSPANGKGDAQKAKTEDGENSGANKTSSVSTFIVFNQRAPQKPSSFSVLRLQLVASEDDLQEALSTVSTATRLQKDISALHAVAMAMQADENSASRDLQAVNARFLNVTETWQERLAAVTADLAALKAESREAHAGATERVNEAERRAQALAKRLEELEDSTKRNARVLERTEEDDAKRAQEHLDWNTKQIHKLQEQIGSLSKREAELTSELQEHIPRAQQCEEQLPKVEEAVRSILKLNGDLSGAEKRLEEVTLQVFGAEDSMLKALNEILEIRQELDRLQAHNSILKMKNELSVVKEAVRSVRKRASGGRFKCYD
uniref:IKBKB interacting protein n=1 Tax=Xiphophorus couchianus TaxID=32473 RepID=A0A3B5M469_9TELE